MTQHDPDAWPYDDTEQLHSAAEQYILVIGNPIGGFNFIGPFASVADAEQHGEPINEEWWVAPLFTPNHSGSNH